jgi:hypothetical protein
MDQSTVEMTLHDGKQKDQRSAERMATVFRPVLIEMEQFAGFCLVRNISPGGLMGKVYTQFAENTPVTVHFNAELQAFGDIIWSKDGKVGVNFDEPIDVSTVLSAKADENKVNRALRLEIQSEGELAVDGRFFTMEVQNISQSGIKVKVPFSVSPNEEVVLRLNGMDPRKASVRWTQFGTAGLNFLNPIGFEELAEWVICQQVEVLFPREESLGGTG